MLINVAYLTAKLFVHCLVLSLTSLASLTALTGGNRGLHGHTGSSSGGLGDEGLVDVRNNSTTGNGSLDEGVKLLVTTDGEQQVTGGDTLHLKILTGITGKLENLSGQVLHDGRSIDGGGGTNTLLGVNAGLQETVNTTDGELQTGTAGA